MCGMAGQLLGDMRRRPPPFSIFACAAARLHPWVPNCQTSLACTHLCTAPLYRIPVPRPCTAPLYCPAGILYSIYPPLFGALVVYSLGGTALSVYIGRPLVGLNFQQEAQEASFRWVGGWVGACCAHSCTLTLTCEAAFYLIVAWAAGTAWCECGRMPRALPFTAGRTTRSACSPPACAQWSTTSWVGVQRRTPQPVTCMRACLAALPATAVRIVDAKLM